MNVEAPARGSGARKAGTRDTDMERGAVVWLTGLSGAGKSTLARAAAAVASARGARVEVLDGDAVRGWLSSGLGFSRADRDENIRRIAHVAELLSKHGVLVLVAAISPYRAARDAARALVGDRFFEVHVSTPLEACAERDPKGLYRRARAGELPAFTGLDDPYEAPDAPELALDTSGRSLDDATAALISALDARGLLPRGAR